MEHHLAKAEDVLASLGSDRNGLDHGEAARRLTLNGANVLAGAARKGFLRRFAGQLANPMIVMLLAAAAISAVVGYAEGGGWDDYAEAAVIIVVVALNGVLGLLQEGKAERAVEALQVMTAATAKVRRGGAIAKVPAAGLVVGDVVALESGDMVPADMRVIQAAGLRMEEAALTGESEPTDKDAGAMGDEGAGASPGDRTNMAYMGTCVARGRGEGVVTATGMGTEMGRIASIIQDTAEGETPLQRRLSQLGRLISLIVLALCAVVFAVRVTQAGGLDAGALLPSFMLAVSLAVAAIPEGLAAVVAIVLSLGVMNMARRNAIVRRLTAVEALGCAQVICSDKTGTLTQNRMAVVEAHGEPEALARAMALCNDSAIGQGGAISGDPTESALVAYALGIGMDKRDLDASHERVAELPFDGARRLMTTFHRAAGGYVQYTKGAPDAVLRACTHIVEADGVVEADLIKVGMIEGRIGALAQRGLRVLACAQKAVDAPPASPSAEEDEGGLSFIGYAAMADPIRPEAKAAVMECRKAGIKVVMVTGDHKGTATAIAEELGILGWDDWEAGSRGHDGSEAGGRGPGDRVIDGRGLDALTDRELMDRVTGISVFARVRPEHKVRIVEAWKGRGFVTAMTGDGVNDAPALKAGDIGVGMGLGGTDVAREVADIVLADDDFATIVHAVGEGRRIYENIRRTLLFLLSTNLSEVIAVLTASVMGLAILRPVHLLFINMISDTMPAVALGTEAAQPGLMGRPPRPRDEGIFADGLGRDVICHGLMISAITLTSFFVALGWGGGEEAMSSAFLTLSMCELFQAFTLRSMKGSVFRLRTHNRMLWGSLVASLALTLTVMYVPPLAEAFSLIPLSPRMLALSLVLALLIVPMAEAYKAAMYRTARKR